MQMPFLRIRNTRRKGIPFFRLLEEWPTHLRRGERLVIAMLNRLEELLRKKLFPYAKDPVEDREEEIVRMVVFRQARGNVHLQLGNYITETQVAQMREKLLSYVPHRT